MIIAIATAIKAQIKSDDLGRIVLNTYLPENINLPAEAKSLLIAKLNQIGTNNGMGAFMTTIIPSDNFKAEIIKLYDEIKKKLQEDQKKKYDFDMLEMQKRYDTEQTRLG